MDNSASDARLKENIVYQLQDKAKDIVSKLKPVMFNYKSDQIRSKHGACWHWRPDRLSLNTLLS